MFSLAANDQNSRAACDDKPNKRSSRFVCAMVIQKQCG